MRRLGFAAGGASAPQGVKRAAQSATVLLLFVALSLAGCVGDDGDDTQVPDSDSGPVVPWLQRGFDARGTFAPPGHPPQWSDVALEVPLDGQPQREIVVIDRHAYALVERGGLGEPRYNDASNGPSALVAVNVDTGTKTTVAEWESPVDSLASDGTRLFATVDEVGVVATTLEGEEAWTYRWPSRTGTEEMRPNWAGCFGGLNVAGGAVTVGCELAVFRDGQPLPTDPYTRWKGESYGMVARLDAETGEERWRWESNATSEAEVLTQEDLPDAGVGNNYAFLRVLPIGISVDRDTVAFLTQEFGLGAARSVLVSLDNETGAFRWSDASDPILPSDVHYDRYSPDNPTTIPASVEVLLSRPTIDDNLVLVKHDGQLQAFNVGTGASVWQRDVGQQDPRPDISPVADMAVVGDRLYVASAQNLFLYAVGADDTTPGWQTNLNPDSGETFEEGPLVVGSTVFMGSWSPGGQHSALYAFDADGGDLRWRLEWPGSDLGDLAYSEGVVAFADRDRGTLVVIGTTDASVEPHVAASDAYPAVGADVVVNLSAAAPGAQGPVSQYRATWGDGSQTGWQTSPVFTHAYESAGDATARFEVRNEAGQTASTIHVFHVGDTPPSEPNLIQTAFERDNQDLTFGILGILLALGGGVLALTQRHTKRGRLQRELEAIDRAYHDTRDDPPECEAVLVERKAHCRGLLMDGKLDEAQFAVLENRVSELARDLRVSALDDRFDFLPYGLVKSLRDMLSDGRVSAWERKHVVRALDEDDVLTKAQKKKVRDLVDGWFRRDAGAAG